MYEASFVYCWQKFRVLYKNRKNKQTKLTDEKSGIKTKDKIRKTVRAFGDILVLFSSGKNNI